MVASRYQARPVLTLTRGMMRRCVHFVGFKDDRYNAAVRAFGPPDFIHRGWDKRARRELADADLIVFADGPHDQVQRVRSYDDIMEPSHD